MGSEQSSRADSNTEFAPSGMESVAKSARGRKSMLIESEAKPEDNFFVEEDKNAFVSDEETEETDEEEEEEESESEDESEEEDEEWDERVRILSDAKKMKQIVNFFLHPEAPVEEDGFAKARCFFSRPSAPSVSEEEWEERARILEDAKSLKKFASFYLHPEAPVEVDGTATARCFFSRPSAPESLPEEEWEERARILQEANSLKKFAGYYLHPEAPVEVDSFASARCFFNRPSAPSASDEEWEERARILEEAESLKKFANFYLHPEAPVEVDAFATARCFFGRPSAPTNTFESEEEWEERARILDEAKSLKTFANFYLHPEAPVEVDGFAAARCFFSRSSAPESISEGEWEERTGILEDAKSLKRFANFFFHPEAPVDVDGFVTARCYFNRPSAPDSLSEDEWVERARILSDAQSLKRFANFFFHPEAPVEVDDFATARCYFSRPSAPDSLSENEWEERARILNDAQSLKKFANFYLHPEAPVEVDDFATARCFFSRPSAPDSLSEDEWEERARILEDAKSLKKFANYYLHPEAPVEVDEFAIARCFFSRPSAPSISEDEWEERASILEDAKSLKKFANYYLHPEAPVEVDAFATARCFFSRPSAPSISEDEWEERARILDEAKSLKKFANYYLHPEAPVEVDAFATARCFFSRPSTPSISEDEWEERARILEEAESLKKFANYYLHPEAPVEVDGFATARSFFSRPSAPDSPTEEEWEERVRVLDEAKNLKTFANFYLHPEAPVEVDGFASARCFFSRPSAPNSLSDDKWEERARILDDAKSLEKFANFFLHPEAPVEVDAFATARCFFNRPSAPGMVESAH